MDKSPTSKKIKAELSVLEVQTKHVGPLTPGLLSLPVELVLEVSFSFTENDGIIFIKFPNSIGDP